MSSPPQGGDSSTGGRREADEQPRVTTDAVTSGLDSAVERVDAERERTAAKRDALDRFHERVREIDATDPRTAGASSSGGAFGAGGGRGAGAAGGGPAGPGGIRGGAGGGTGGRGDDGGGSRSAASGSGDTSGCAAVRRAFADCVGGYSGDADESHDTVHEAIAAEFSEEIAVSLASGNGGGLFTPQLKRGVVNETERRQAELSVMETALEREASSLATTRETQRAVVEWLGEHNPTPLSSLSFDELAAHHERLATFRRRLDDAAETRQAFLDEATGERARVGIRHEDLVAYLYSSFADDHPALGTLGRLDELCGEAQRTLRDHLTRRV
ncbi:hypothetical protein RYH80_14955 [Halobaculum sp. MBLA0147]|uniref:DUF7260 family protein n=1 Tax=Halobaculum sp. MBLA0147 TaxID=3079934 RepID=UPI003524CEF8